MDILNAIQLKNGAKVDRKTLYGVTQPLQFIPKKKKNDEWAQENMDWLEWQGLKQIKANSERFLKNYRLAEGIIDKTDYMPEPDNDMNDLVKVLDHSEDKIEALEMQFYPIIPNIVNTLMGEFARRDKRVSFRAVDEYTYNEILERKRQDIENILVRDAEQKMLIKMIEQGLDPESPEVQEQMQQQLSQENLQQLPNIEDFYNKNYQVICEKWASKQHLIDEDRFSMEELEETAFKDMLCTNREFWHFKMYEDDYDIEVWNPILTFYHKSPQTKYISNAQYVGYIDIMTVSDVIDNYGWRMTEEQLRQLETDYKTELPGYAIAGSDPESFYDATRSYKWNREGPSLGMRQYMSAVDHYMSGSDIVNAVLNNDDSNNYPDNRHLMRVTTAYWKSQMKIGFLTKIDESGMVTNDIVTEDYVVTDKPVYNNDFYKSNERINLIFGEHIEWIWINQVWGGVKIAPNGLTPYGLNKDTGIDPLYLGINQNKIRPLKFQFKGEQNLYGCKLPVEGCVFENRNTKSMSLVDIEKPFQIGYNIVNNQMSEILSNEIGTVVMLDQNAIPKHSLGEDWGKNNLAKAYVAMKDFSMLPLDTSIQNTENATNFNHYQMLDMSQTQRLTSRIQLAQYFKQQAYELVGVSPQRMATPIGQKITATEAEQIQVSSFSQTEHFFINHSDNLMPRVHQMRTDLAQWYACYNPSIRIQISLSDDERTNFEVNRDDLLMRDLHVYCTTRTNQKRVLDEMKRLAINNNTTGSSIYDLGKILQADSLGTLNSVLKESEKKQQQQIQAQQQHELEMQQQEQEAQMREKQMEYDFQAQEKEKDRRNSLLIAEIRASGYGAMQDINQNQQSDFMDNMDRMRKTDAYLEEVNIKKEKADHSAFMDRQKMDLKRQELAVKRETNMANLTIAKENKNRYDFPNAKPPKKEKK